MALSIRAQGLSLLLALGAGAALGLLYDLLRPLRRRSRDGLWDLLFCAAAAACCFLLAMREENGRLPRHISASAFCAISSARQVLPSRKVPSITQSPASDRGRRVRATNSSSSG